ncbi:MAG TPA: heme-binding domain-containing protein [Myxococcota bacterium]
MKIRLAVGVVCALLVIQLIPAIRTNPAVESEVPAPEEVRQVLRNACYDCHSHETRWPWYGHVAPFSWLVMHDVSEAREHLNFSAWGRYDARKQRKKLDEIWEEVEDGEMPLWYYLPFHPEARLSESDKQRLRAWTAQGG